MTSPYMAKEANSFRGRLFVIPKTGVLKHGKWKSSVNETVIFETHLQMFHNVQSHRMYAIYGNMDPINIPPLC